MDIHSQWIGGRSGQTGWKWSGRSTELIDYNWWVPGEPNGDGPCVTVLPDTYKFNDAPCSIDLPFFCEKCMLNISFYLLCYIV